MHRIDSPFLFLPSFCRLIHPLYRLLQIDSTSDGRSEQNGGRTLRGEEILLPASPTQSVYDRILNIPSPLTRHFEYSGYRIL